MGQCFSRFSLDRSVTACQASSLSSLPPQHHSITAGYESTCHALPGPDGAILVDWEQRPLLG